MQPELNLFKPFCLSDITNEETKREKNVFNEKEESTKAKNTSASACFYFGHQYSEILGTLPKELIFVILDFKTASESADATMRLFEHDTERTKQIHKVKFDIAKFAAQIKG